MKNRINILIAKLQNQIGKRVWKVVFLGNCKLEELTLPKYHSLAIFNPGKNIRLKEYKGNFIILLPRAVINSGDWIEL